MELVVALALLSLLSLLILQIIAMSHRGWETGTDAATRIDTVVTVQQSLRRLLSGIRPLQDRDTCGGHADGLTFVAATPGATGTGTTARFHLGIEESGGTKQITLDWCAYRTSSSTCASDEAERETLMSDLVSASLSYYRNGAWSTEWADCAAVPELIRIDAAFPPQDHRHWPDLSIHPRYSASADCRFDLVSERCSPP